MNDRRWYYAKSDDLMMEVIENLMQLQLFEEAGAFRDVLTKTCIAGKEERAKFPLAPAPAAG